MMSVEVLGVSWGVEGMGGAVMGAVEGEVVVSMRGEEEDDD